MSASQLLLLDTAASHDPGGKVRIRIPIDWTRFAEFSPCERYRYKLWRGWNAAKPHVLWLMTNPSVAEAEFNDPTVAKCCRLSERWGFGGCYIANACAYRSTSPKGLLAVEDPVGPRNLTAILEMAVDSAQIIVAHGNLPGKLQFHATKAVNLLRGVGYSLHVLKLSNSGVPSHPLYLREDTEPVLWP